MIKVVKPAASPAILLRRGTAENKRHCCDFDSSPNDYMIGLNSIEYDESIYNAKSVKKALLTAQHSKCCYCECKISPGSFGDIEHYRPKGGYQIDKGSPIMKPGYFWVAYEWSNLYLACQVCNQSFKKNLFPLKEEKSRCRTHHDSLDSEIPLLIDPGKVDPTKFIAFREEVSYPIRGNIYGIKTIEILKLNDRQDLLDSRYEVLSLIKLLINTRKTLAKELVLSKNGKKIQRQIDKIDKKLKETTSAISQYSLMAQWALKRAKIPQFKYSE